MRESVARSLHAVDAEQVFLGDDAQQWDDCNQDYYLRRADAVISVAERAIREALAREILDQETWLRGCVDFTANERQVGMINGYRLAARIAKGD